MNPIERALAQADDIIAANKELERVSAIRPLYTIAREIDADWRPVNYAARPYLDAMYQLVTTQQSYGYDSGESVVLYFLSNASSWRGETARRVKAELKGMLK